LAANGDETRDRTEDGRSAGAKQDGEFRLPTP